MSNALGDEEAASRLLKQQLTTELRGLDAKEENLLDLAADGTLPQTKIKAKLHDIERQRRHLRDRLNETTEDLSATARLIELGLTLLENPQALYQRCDDEQRRLLNQAIFYKLYIDHDRVTDYELRDPFARLHSIQSGEQAQRAQHDSRAVSQTGDGPAGRPIEDLLAGMGLVHCSSKPSMVEHIGFEPMTSSMPWKRATNCANAPNFAYYSKSPPLFPEANFSELLRAHPGHGLF